MQITQSVEPLFERNSTVSQFERAGPIFHLDRLIIINAQVNWSGYWCSLTILDQYNQRLTEQNKPAPWAELRPPPARGCGMRGQVLAGGTMVLLHGFVKKTQSSPVKELKLAARRLKAYKSETQVKEKKKSGRGC